MRKVLKGDDLLGVPSVIRTSEVTLDDTEETALIHERKCAVGSHLANGELKGEVV
jgi:hypothetical protein